MDAGKYYVGDLCYVLSDNEWQEVCQLMSYDNGMEKLKLSSGKEICLSNTAYGDGTYTDEEGREYWVDSGTIGCVLVSDMSKNHNGEGGNIIDFPNHFNCFENDGTLAFGNVVIKTGNDAWDNEDEEDDEWEDEEEDEEED